MATHDPDLLYCGFIDSVVNHRRLEHLDQFLAAYPDLHLVIEDLVVEGDHLMARLAATGSHRGSLAGIEPAGRQVSVAVFEAWSVPDDRCVERWLYLDRCALRRQLGPSPATPT